MGVGLLLPLRGRVLIELGGRLVYETANLFVNSGYHRVNLWLAGLAPNPPSHIAVGNGDGSAQGQVIAPQPSDSQLRFELLRKPLSAWSAPSAYTARLVAQFPAAAVQRTITEVGLFDAPGDDGSVSSATASTLVDSSKAWGANAWVGNTVYITSGTGAGQQRAIVSNSENALSVSPAWQTVPNSSSKYTIGGVNSGTYMFARASLQVTKGDQPLNVIWILSQTTG